MVTVIPISKASIRRRYSREGEVEGEKEESRRRAGGGGGGEVGER